MAKFFLTGDTVKGLEYTARALHELKRMKLEESKDTNRTVILEKDVSVRVVLDPVSGDRIYIHAIGCPLVPFSGFMDAFVLADPNAYGAGGQSWRDKYLMAAQVEAEQRNIVVPPATTIVPKFYGVRTVATPAPLSLTTKLPIDPGSATRDYDEQGNDKGTYTATVTTHDFKRIYARWRPSLFTGLLRKVWQCSCQRMILSAISSETYGNWSSASVGIDYHFGNSYGVIKNAGAHYLVKITTDKVYYVPAEFCAKVVKIDGVDTDIVQLISVQNSGATQIGTVAGVQSWSDEIGWAFSYDSPRASIVSPGSKLSGAPPAYTTVTLCHISFTFDPISGEPSAATLTKGAEQIFWSHLQMDPMISSAWGLFNVPRYGAVEPGTPPKFYNESVNFGVPYPYMGQVPSDGGYSTDIPVYVYYTEKKGMVTCKYSHWKENRHKANGETGEPYWVWKFDAGGVHESLDTRPIPDATFLYGAYSQQGYVAGVSYEGWEPIKGYGYSTVSQTEANRAAHGAGSYAPSASSPAGYYPIAFAGVSSVGEFTGGNYSVSYSATNDGYWGSTYVHVGDSVFSAIVNVIVSGAPSGGVVGDITSKESLSSLTLSLSDREAHLVYSQIDRSHSYWEFTQNVGWVMIGYDTPGVQPGSRKLVLHGGGTSVDIDAESLGANYRMLSPHPKPIELEYHSSQAAFDPNRVVYATTPGNGVPLVKINGAEYPVENQLYGWVGVI